MKNQKNILLGVVSLMGALTLAQGCGGDDKNTPGCPDCPLTNEMQWNADTQQCRDAVTGEVLDKCCCDGLH